VVGYTAFSLLYYNWGLSTKSWGVGRAEQSSERIPTTTTNTRSSQILLWCHDKMKIRVKYKNLLLLILILLFSDIDLFFNRRIRGKMQFLGGVNSMIFYFFGGEKNWPKF
jgi:hypothetical protein